MIYSFIITHSILLTTLPYTPHLFKFKLILNWWYIFPINYVDHASMIQFILCVWGSNHGNLLIGANIMLVLVHFTQFSMLQVCLMSFFHPLHPLTVKSNMKFSIMRRCKSCSARPFPGCLLFPPHLVMDPCSLCLYTLASFTLVVIVIIITFIMVLELKTLFSFQSLAQI